MSKIFIFLAIVTVIVFYIIGQYSKPNIICNDHFVVEGNKKFENSVSTHENSKNIQQSKTEPNDCDKKLNTYVHLNSDIPGLQNVFSMMHHASCPVDTEAIVSTNKNWKNDYSLCSSVFALRSPVREDQSNRCVGIVQTDNTESILYSSFTNINHRTGVMTWPQKLTNQYQDDYIHRNSLQEEKIYSFLFLKERENILNSFRSMMGDPMLPSGKKRTLVLMIANEGVMDLLLNLLCSVRKIPSVDLRDFVVFVGDAGHVAVVEAMGARAFFHAGLGSMPRQAAANYADKTFSKIMWTKITSVYIAIACGFDALFQDVDLVWMRDAVSFLSSSQSGLDDFDIVFMDDGARTPRFSPYFTNTGFYLVRSNPRTQFLQERLSRAIGEIAYTASHQATLIRHLAEAVALAGLTVKVLPDQLFPSGRMYHEHKDFVADVKNHKAFPYVWHMCWTDNRDQKVSYYKSLGLWFIRDENTHEGLCVNGAKMFEHLSVNSNSRLTDCCTNGGYWTT